MDKDRFGNVSKLDEKSIAPIENGSTSSKAYSKGAHFMRGGDFCTALLDISLGGGFTLNTNYKVDSVSSSIEAIETKTNKLNLGKITSLTEAQLLTLPNGKYEIRVDDTTVFPEQWGVLIVSETGADYKSYTYITTYGDIYNRVCNVGLGTFYAAWKKAS